MTSSEEAPGLVWTSGGDAFWFGQTNTTRDGQVAAQSGQLADNQRCSFQTVIAGPGTLNFWWKVSSEQWFDFLTFSMDGIQRRAISGEVDWQLETMVLPRGLHTLAWTYAKDLSGSAGLDAGWVAQVAFVSDLPVITQQPLTQTVQMGGGINLSVMASGPPPLTYQWLKDGTNLADQTLPSLNILKAARRDSGVYGVAVSNSSGITLSADATVRVLVPASLVNPQWLDNQGVSLVAVAVDGGGLLPEDLVNFEAQVSTNLVQWDPVDGSLMLTNGAILLFDPQATNYPARFYRISEH